MSQFEVKGKISLDGAQVSRTLKSIKSDVLSYVTFDRAKKEMDDLIARAKLLKKLNREFGVDTSVLQAQEFALKAQGKTLEDLEAIWVRFQRTRKMATDKPDSKQAKLFEALGISPEEFSLLNKDFGGLFEKVRSKLSKMGPGGLPYFGEMFGRGSAATMGTKLGPQYEKLMTEFEKLGVVMEVSTINSLVELSKAIALTRVQLQQWSAWLISKISTAASMYGAAAGNYDFWKAFKDIWTSDRKPDNEFDRLMGDIASGQFGRKITATVRAQEEGDKADAAKAAKEQTDKQMAAVKEVMDKFKELSAKKEEDTFQTVRELRAVKGKDLTSLQQVGAYTSVGNPLVEIQLKQLKVQEKIAANTEPNVNDDLDIDL